MNDNINLDWDTGEEFVLQHPDELYQSEASFEEDFNLVSISPTYFNGDCSKKLDRFTGENIFSAFVKRSSFLVQSP